MKRIALFVLLLTFSVCQLFAQAPQGFNYQAVVRNSAGQIVTNSTVSLRLSILQGSETGTPVYTYQGNVQTNANGAFTLLVGENSTEYAAIDWANGPYFLSCEIDPRGGSNYSLSTVQQIMSVPYAQYAAVADRISSSFTYDEKDPDFHDWNFLYDSLVNAPTNLSQFVNDLNLSDFNNDLNIYQSGDTLFFGDNYLVIDHAGLDSVRWTDVIGRPTNLSQFVNDLNLSDFNNDLNLSDFNNDLNIYQSGDTLFFGDNYLVIDHAGLDSVRWTDVIGRPTNLSQFVNDLNLSDFNNDLNIYQSGDTLFFGDNYLVIDHAGLDSVRWTDVIGRPTNLSQFVNDLNLSDFNNDLNIYQSGDTLFFGDNFLVIDHSGLDSVRWTDVIGRPTNLSQFTNDMGFVSTETQGLSDVLAINNNASLGLTNLPWPAASSDAANKLYADSTAALAAAAAMASLQATIDSLRGTIDSLRNAIDTLTIQVNNPSVNIDSIFHVVDSLAHPQIPGSITFRFSVEPDKQIIFSKGNLQYNPSKDLFRFAENQYDITSTDNDQISENCNVWLDLFGYGTSGWKGGRMCYRPYETNPISAQYMFSSTGEDLTDYNVNGDWGVYNRIINGSNQEGIWRTMTYSEWSYLLNERANAGSLKTLATINNNVKGLILFPDGWTAPAGINTSAFSMITYNSFSPSSAQWQLLEASGAVFLPAAGVRQGNQTTGVNETGIYWTSTHNNGTQSRTLSITNTLGALMTETNCSLGCSVRLVRDY